MAYSVLEQCFNTQFPIPSGPVALCTLNWVNKRLTSSSVVLILSIRAFYQTGNQADAVRAYRGQARL